MNRRIVMPGWAAMAVAGILVAAQAASAQTFTGVVAFGDSLTDRGNTIALMGTGLPSLTGYDQFYYDSAYNDYNIASQGRYSNGPTWVEYLNALVLNGPTPGAPVDLGRNDGTGDTSAGTNFAWAGSLTEGGLLPGLTTQINNYTNSTHTGSASTTLFTLWSGGNDAIGWVEDTVKGEEGVPDLATATSTAATNIINAITLLYTETDARHIIVPNLPALGYKPSYNGEDPQEGLANSFTALFNTKLATGLAELELVGLNLYQLDIESLFEDLRAHPETYGFSNIDNAAFTLGSDHVVDDYDEYVFWDQTHPTTRVHDIMGTLAYNQVMIPEPGTYVLLITGGAIGCWLRRSRKQAA